MSADRFIRCSKPAVFLACLAPMGLLARKGLANHLGANPNLRWSPLAILTPGHQ